MKFAYGPHRETQSSLRSRVAAALAALTLLLVLGVCAAPARAGAGGGPGGCQPFSGCGTLVQGVECVLFQADSGGLYVINDLGGFNVGDDVTVTGCLDPVCNTTCQQGDGCILDNTIAEATCVTAPADLVSWWPLDEQIPITAQDIGPGNHHGTHVSTPNGSPTPTLFGKVDGALTFSGTANAISSDHVQIPHDPDFNVGLTQDFSIDAWVRTSGATQGGGVIIGKMNPGPTDLPFGWILSLVGSDCELAFGMSYNDGGSTFESVAGVYSGVNLCDGDWHFVAVTVQRILNGGRLYVDGGLAVTWNPDGLVVGPDNFDPVRIGSQVVFGFPESFNGTIDEVEFYHRALSDDEISSIYQADCAGKCKPCPGPSCGDGACEGDETMCNCADCPFQGCGACADLMAICGNGLCELCGSGESHESCPQDCPCPCPECGDGVCEGDETSCNCFADCPVQGCGGLCLTVVPTCGDNQCEVCVSPAESHESCPQDCPCALSSCVQPPPDMVDWWPFDEQGGTTAGDLASSPNNGTHVNNPAPSPGRVDFSLCFDGVNQSVVVPDHGEIDFLGTCNDGNAEPLTIDVWVRTGATGLQVILDKRETALDFLRGYTLFIVDGRLGFQMATGPGNASCGTSGSACTNFVSPMPGGSIPDLGNNDWHFVAVTVDRCVAGGGRMYIDGNLVHTFTPLTGDISNAVDLLIGERYPINTTINFNGCLDELEFFKRSLSESDLDLIHAAGSAGKCKPCGDAPYPTCDGLCPPGGMCAPDDAGGAFCGCVPVPPMSCESTFPACDGFCPPDLVCRPDPITGAPCICVLPTPTAGRTALIVLAVALLAVLTSVFLLPRFRRSCDAAP